MAMSFNTGTAASGSLKSRPIKVFSNRHWSRHPDEFFQVIDLFPTIAAATGIKPPANLPGINLLDKDARGARERVFGVTHATHNMTPGDPDDSLQYLWCVERDWKLIQRFHGKDTTGYRNLHIWDETPTRLFRIRDDPQEKRDLATQNPEQVKRLKALILTWRESFNE